MNARTGPGGDVEVTMDYAEVIVLHEALAYAEWSGDFDAVSWRDPLYRDVLTALQQVLAPTVRELGSSDYGHAVDAALGALRRR